MSKFNVGDLVVCKHMKHSYSDKVDVFEIYTVAESIEINKRHWLTVKENNKINTYLEDCFYKIGEVK